MATEPTSVLTTVGELNEMLRKNSPLLLDARFFLPTEGRDAHQEYLLEHLPGAVFFDIDAISDHANPLPHMLPSASVFGKMVAALGVSNSDRIVCYDEGRMMGACRAWWMFRLFGHQRITVLDGGLPRWKSHGGKLGHAPVSRPEGHYYAEFNPGLVSSLNQVRQALDDNSTQVIDARSTARFTGQSAEPRAGLRSGHMPGALNLPFTELLSPDGTFKNPSLLRQLFKAAGLDLQLPVITTCGSGVSAAALLLGLDLIGHTDHAVYDGSWAEWGGRDDTPVVRD